MKYHLVTTTNASGWEQTGRRMAESVRKHWPADILFTVYAEGFDPGEGYDVRELPDWMAEFKAKWSNIPQANGTGRSLYDYRFDAVKFAHKVAALTDLASTLTDGILIWLDADTFTHADVTEEWLDSLFPGDGYIAWLDRARSHPECGFVMFRCSHPYHQAFMASFRGCYETGRVFRLPETHDSYVLQHLVTVKRMNGKIEAPVSLSGDTGWHHPFVNGPLGAKIDHMKGPRKEEGRSRLRDLRRPRTEEYWRVG